jgi:hypothetical protein
MVSGFASITQPRRHAGDPPVLHGDVGHKSSDVTLQDWGGLPRDIVSKRTALYRQPV